MTTVTKSSGKFWQQALSEAYQGTVEGRLKGGSAATTMLRFLTSVHPHVRCPAILPLYTSRARMRPNSVSTICLCTNVPARTNTGHRPHLAPRRAGKKRALLERLRGAMCRKQGQLLLASTGLLDPLS